MDDRIIVNELQNGSTQSLLACKSCRIKKLKCDRNIPQCQNCGKASRACEYPEVAQKPGPRPGSHRRAADIGGLPPNKRRAINLDQSHFQSTATGSSSYASGQYNEGSTSAYSHSTPSKKATRLSPDLMNMNDHMLSTVCRSMRISEQSCLKMIEVYFDSMTAFSLFHQPTFRYKLASIESPKQAQALLTSMFAFGIRFMKSSDVKHNHDVHPGGILETAYRLSQDCLGECRDEPPPLHLLQSFVLQALLFSTYGVKGKAWRLVGQCVRLAYELRLHELDLTTPNKDARPDMAASQREDWTLAEEKRRTWWAIFECDIFTSTIQRLPNAIDWTRNRTNLPIPDASWFNNAPSPSCHLQADPIKRWRDLRDSGNTSPIAWFIVLNSYKWDALSVTQRIAPPTTFFDLDPQLKSSSKFTDSTSILTRKRETLENCVRCAIGAIPNILQPNSFLTFEPSRGPYPVLNRIHDNGVYMIAIMAQVTQLLLSRKDLEGGDFIAYPPSHHDPTQTSTPNLTPAQSTRWQRSFHASNTVASMIRSSSAEHYKYVNPNMATALWMAAATQLTVLTFHRDAIDAELAQSNFDLLTSTIENCVNFWDVPRTLLVSLGTLEEHLLSMGGRRRSGGYGMEDARHEEVVVPQAVGNGGSAVELSPFDVLQAMDFGAMYNGVENWENLFLDPGFLGVDFAL